MNLLLYISIIMSDNKNATGKSGTAKPNTNAPGSLDSASKATAETAIGKPPAESRAEDAPKNEAATKREEA